MSEKQKSNLNSWLIAAITIMVGLVSYIYINDASANTEFRQTETKALNELVNQMIELRTANFHEHKAINDAIKSHECWSEDVMKTQIKPNSKWRVDGEPRLEIVEKKIGIY